MSARTRFCQLVTEQIGKPVLWCAQGPLAFDCSGLVMWALLELGAKDRALDRKGRVQPLRDHRAQDFSDETPAIATAPGAVPLPGDLGFYGESSGQVIHVVVWLAGGMVLSADGATSKVTDLETALENPASRVRLHDSTAYRRGFLGLHRNRFVDELDRVTR